MKKKFKIALIGRPNVGKSALFNRIIGKRIAIVDEQEGITRDRIYGESELFGTPFELIDTGGITRDESLPFREEVKQQAEIAIEEADSLVMVVDGRIGITDLDEMVAKLIRRSGKPICLAVNKVDNESQEGLVAPFHALGIQHLCAVSAIQGYQIAELLQIAMASSADWEGEEDENSGDLKVAIIGRPNVGKSTLINTLLDEKRCVVSPIAGTTRDAIDVSVSFGGKSLTFIDTAGIRRKKSEHEVVDKFAAIRTLRAIRRADICLLLLDATQGISSQDKKIAQMIEQEGKGCVLLLNKWDLVKGYRMEHCLKGIRDEASFLNYCPTLCISALSGRNIEKIFSAVEEVSDAQKLRITTGQLNKFIEGAIQRQHPPMLNGKRLRIYYMAQVDSSPPRFIFFVNNSKFMDATYKKYLVNQFRKTYLFTGSPLRFFMKSKPPQKKGEQAPTQAEPLFAIPESDLLFEES